MRRLLQLLLGTAVLLILISMGTCFFGVRYEIAKIPPEEIARRGDTDWIGAEWILRGFILLLIGVVLAVASLIIWLSRIIATKRSQQKRTPTDGLV
jgi:hypothetical protein